MEPATAAQAGSYNAGVGIAVRKHLGHSAVDDLVQFECCEGRVLITHLGAVCRGGISLFRHICGVLRERPV